MSHSKINQDLKDERDKISFDIEEFTTWYYGGRENLQEKRFLGKYKSVWFNILNQMSCRSTENFILSDPELQNMEDMSYLSHKEKYEEAIRRSTLVLKKVKILQKSEGWKAEDLNR